MGDKSQLESIQKSIRQYLSGKSQAECTKFLKLINDEFDLSEPGCWVIVPDCYGADKSKKGVSGNDSNMKNVTSSQPVAVVPTKKSFFACCGGMSTKQLSAIAQANLSPEGKSAVRLTVDTKQVDQFLDQLLEDPQFGSYITPDVFERMAYRIVVESLVKSILKNVYSLDGKDLFGCHIACKESVVEDLVLPKLHIDRKPIAALVQELLKDKDINLSFVPDAIEAHVYQNSIILGFSVLQIFFLQNQFHVYGHTLGGVINPIPKSILTSPIDVAKRWKVDEAAESTRLGTFAMEEQVSKLLGSSAASIMARPMASAMIRLMHRLFAEFLRELRVNAFGNVISFKLVRN